MSDIPPLLDEATRLYEAMLEHSKQGEEGHTVWEGSTVKFAEDECSIPQSKYSYVIRALKTMGCIDMVRRGANAQGSVWALWYPPTEQLFKDKLGGTAYKYVADRGPLARERQELQMIRDLAKRLDKAELRIAQLERG